MERALVLDAANEKEGGAQELRWLAEQITDASGGEHVVHFDITSFFGRN